VIGISDGSIDVRNVSNAVCITENRVERALRFHMIARAAASDQGYTDDDYDDDDDV